MAEVTQILTRILEDAAQEEKSILEQAQQEVQRILQQAEAQAEAACKKEEQQAEAQVQAIQKRLESALTTEQKKAMLAEKQHLIDDAFSGALERLSDLPQDVFMAYVEKKLKETSLKGEAKLVVPAKYKFGFLNLLALNAKLHGLKVSLSDEPREVQSGFLLICGLVEENYTFEAQLQAMRDELSAGAAEILLAQ